MSDFLPDVDPPAIPQPGRTVPAPYQGNGMAPAPLAAGGLVSVEQQRALGELQAQIMLAKLYPRDQLRVVADLKRLDCTRLGLAERAEYTYSRGGQDISGPSIRIMEAIARRWGNIQSGIKELSRDKTDGVGYSECVAYCWDLESGYRDEKQFRVRHVRDVRNRETRQMEQRPLTDERDIYELVANQGARRKRSCLEAVIPGDVVEEIVEECRRTLHAQANTDPESMKKLLAAFAEFGVTQRQIEARIQRNLGAIRPAQVVQLRRIYAAIKDGITTVQAEFQPEPRPTPAPSPEPPPAPPQAPPRAAPPAPRQPATQPEAPRESARESPAPETFREQPDDNVPVDLGDVPDTGAEFEYLLMNQNGEPVDGEVHLDPLRWAQAFLELWSKAAEIEDEAAGDALLMHNADALQDACAVSPEADALLDGILPELEAELEAEEPEAPQAPVESTPEPDADERLANTIIVAASGVSSPAELIAYSKSPDVLGPIQRWQKAGQLELVTRVKAVFVRRLEGLRRRDTGHGNG